MRSKGKTTILIVDDNRANLLALENILERKDWLIINASNGRDALKLTLNKKIDLIILDVQMPDMDGFEVAQILKSNNRTKDIPIIFASAEKTEHKFMMKGFEEGAVDYLSKPMDPDLARAKVSVLLKLHLQHKELAEKNNSLEKAALLINNSADIIGIINANTFKIEEINNAFSAILGYTPEEAKESTLLFFLSNEDRNMVQKLGKDTNDRISFETRIYCKNRTIKWLQWNIVARNSKWFANARDITEIKQVEIIRNYLTTIVKQSNDAIYIYNEEGKIISWNNGAEEIYGYSEKEAREMSIWNIIPEFFVTETEKFKAKIISGEKIKDFETKRITKHGKVIDVICSASLIINTGDEKKAIAVNERDITNQKLADEQIKQLNSDLRKNVSQLESSNKELESFSYSISHDLRAPLRAVDGYARMLEEDYTKKLDSEGKRLLETIQYNAQKMSTLIDDLLAFSRLGKKSIQKSDIDMNMLINGVVNEIDKSTQHNAKIEVESLLPTLGDYSLLNQVATNLISNAIKYSSKNPNPQIKISSSIIDNNPVYSIKDNGVGFDMKYAYKLFGVFQRLHTPDEFEGTGVGLAIVQRIISKHGGKIWVDAELNKGATFNFMIPTK